VRDQKAPRPHKKSYAGGGWHTPSMRSWWRCTSQPTARLFVGHPPRWLMSAASSSRSLRIFFGLISLRSGLACGRDPVALSIGTCEPSCQRIVFTATAQTRRIAGGKDNRRLDTPRLRASLKLWRIAVVPGNRHRSRLLVGCFARQERANPAATQDAPLTHRRSRDAARSGSMQGA